MSGDVLAIASQANVGGSTTAMAVAGARRRPDLIPPGVAVGILGNAFGNHAGIAIALLARGLLGGALRLADKTSRSHTANHANSYKATKLQSYKATKPRRTRRSQSA